MENNKKISTYLFIVVVVIAGSVDAKRIEGLIGATGDTTTKRCFVYNIK